MTISNSEIMKLKFVGGFYDDNIKLKKEIVESLDEFEKKKLLCLNELYIENEGTIISYWRIYKKYVYEYEVITNKDLMKFSTDEIKGIILANTTIRSTTQKTIKTIVSAYLNWCISRGEININIADTINVNKEGRTNKKLLSRMIINIKSINKCMNFLYDSDKELNGSITLILARYGIIGNSYDIAIDLTFSNIDMKNKIIYVIRDGEILSKIPIDNVFIKWIKKLKEEYPNRPYVLMNKNDEGDIKQVDKLWISQKIYTTSKYLYDNSEIKFKMSGSDLQKSRILDFLLRIRMEKYISIKDIINVCSIFSGKKLYSNSSRVMTIGKVYLELTNYEDFIISKQTVNRTPKFNTDCLDKLVKEYNIDIKYIKKNVPLITDENISEYLLDWEIV